VCPVPGQNAYDFALAVVEGYLEECQLFATLCKFIGRNLVGPEFLCV
jgi:hypothetical protein